MKSRTNRREFLKLAPAAAVGMAVGSGIGRLAPAIPPIERARPSRLKLSLAAYSFRKYLQSKNADERMTLFDFMDYCADLRLDGTELTGYYFPPNPDAEYFAQIKRRAHILGIDISGTATSNDFCRPPGDARNREVAKVKMWVDYAAQFGANVIRIFSGSVPKGGSLEETRGWFVDTVEEACAHAATKGVFLALENHGGISIPIESLLTICEKVKSPWFGLNLDTGNFHSADPYKDMELAAPYAVNVQVKVEVSPRGGKKAHADYDRIVEILRKAKYSGYLALEYESAEDPKTAVPKEIDLLRKAMAGASS